MEYHFHRVSALLRQRFEAELPGFGAQSSMAPDHRKPAQEYLNETTDFRLAAVMAVLFPDEQGDTRIILMERTGGKDVHANQISFPGGKVEAEDANFMQTALRETIEEVGLRIPSEQVLGALSPLYIPPSKFLVHPFVSLYHEQPQFMVSEHEVKRIITPSIASFMQAENKGRDVFQSARGYQVDAPYYLIEGSKVWGATAMMIAELMALFDE